MTFISLKASVFKSLYEQQKIIPNNEVAEHIKAI